jgi:DNA-binding transcriptional LysR family regulator
MSDYTPETSELEAFVRTVDTGSVSAAARALKTPRVTVSRRLTRLEDGLGMRLMHRTTRALRLTASGEAFYTHARGIVLAVQAATEAMRRHDGVPRGLLRISVPPIPDPAFRDQLLSFATRYPEVELEIITSNRHEDLISQRIDVAFRAGTTLEPNLVARKLMASQVVAVASPDYLAQAGVPEHPDALQTHALLVGFTGGSRPATHWPLLGGGQVAVSGRVISNDLQLLSQGAVRGLGIALLPTAVCGPDLASGVLQQVLEDQVGATSQIALVFPTRRLLDPSVRAFVDHMVAEFAKVPFNGSPHGG